MNYFILQTSSNLSEFAFDSQCSASNWSAGDQLLFFFSYRIGRQTTTKKSKVSRPNVWQMVFLLCWHRCAAVMLSWREQETGEWRWGWAGSGQAGIGYPIGARIPACGWKWGGWCLCQIIKWLERTPATDGKRYLTLGYYDIETLTGVRVCESSLTQLAEEGLIHIPSNKLWPKSLTHILKVVIGVCNRFYRFDHCWSVVGEMWMWREWYIETKLRLLWGWVIIQA